MYRGELLFAPFSYACVILEFRIKTYTLGGVRL